jgi:P-type Cu+ transporter
MDLTIALVVMGLLVAVIAVIAWNSTRATVRICADGSQEMTIHVRGRYRPGAFRAYAGIPLRIHFARDEEEHCSDRVFIPDFGIERRLPAHRTTTIDVLPDSQGEFLFTCQNGIYIGLIDVKPRNSVLMLIGTSPLGRGLRATVRRGQDVA